MTLPQPACARASPPNASRRPGLRFAHPIRPSNPFSVLGIPSCRSLPMIPTGYSLPKCSPSPDRKKQIPILLLDDRVTQMWRLPASPTRPEFYPLDVPFIRDVSCLVMGR